MSAKLQSKVLLAVATVSLAALVVGEGCVANRPSRNGVFNENQYVRKDFLVRPGDQTNPDSGWILNATVTDASQPNVFGNASVYGLFAGASGADEDLLHFVVTEDKLQMVSNREIDATPSAGTQGEVVNAWPITNVDLKYRVNLDGEKSNFYEENQELDWKSRQWVKVNFDKNDMSDLAPLGWFYNANIGNCADLGNSSATLVPDSFIVDEAHNYMEWSVQVTLPIKWTTDCIESFGPMGPEAQRLGRSNETVTLKYSLMRANAHPTYPPLMVAEKDPIQKKYGPILFDTLARDPSSGLLASNQYVERFDPTKAIRWYFESTFPPQYMPYFTRNHLPPGISPLADGYVTIEDATNKLLQDAGATARVSFHQFDEPLDDGTPIQRHFGDVRFSMLRWIQSLDQQSDFAGVTSNVTDPRTGETLASNIVFENFAIKDYYAQRLDAYLQTIGASAGSPFNPASPWPNPPTAPDANGNPQTLQCTSGNIGQSIPIVSNTAIVTHNGGSTLFQKIQGYLYRPVAQFGALGPQDFVVPHNDDNGDFYRAYFAVVPYLVYADPAMNPFVTPESGSANTGPATAANLWNMIHGEAQLHALESQLDHGTPPYDITGATGSQDALAFLATYRGLTLNHRALVRARQELPLMPGLGRAHLHADALTDFSMEDVVGKDGRHCVDTCPVGMKCPAGPHWESKDEWVADLIASYWSQVFWHEFGHAMGLEHNFMGSVDKPNFPAAQGTNPDGSEHYLLYSSSVMEYNAEPDRVFWHDNGWAPYDKGAIAWMYANDNGNPANVPQKPSAGATAQGISGQLSPKYPWLDPDGFCKQGDVGCTAGRERQFLYCNERDTAYTPLCRPNDMGTTPSEITANDIDAYEWKYQWRNFRQYHKIWDDAAYGDTPMNFIGGLRRFISLWQYDMSASELTSRFQQLGIVPPPNAPSAQLYYAQLVNKFNNEMSGATTLASAFHEAIIQQSSGQRPYATVFDNYFGDVTQQGITLDKLDALQSFLALWPVDDYDPTQAAGAYLASYTPLGVQNQSGSGVGSLYQTVEEQAVTSMIGGAYASFAYFKPLGDALFTTDTHSDAFLNATPAGSQRYEIQDWTGGWEFDRLEDFLSFFRDIAVQNHFSVNIPGYLTINCTDTVADCNWDPRIQRAYQPDTFLSDAYNQFVGPDGRRYIWVYLKDRNQWFACDRDRNIATYQVMFNYTTDVIFGKDDGNAGPAYADEEQIKYFMDYFDRASQFTP